MKKILLYPRRKQLYALVDAADYERVSGHRWYIRDDDLHPYRLFEHEEGYGFESLHGAVMGKIPKDRVIDHVNCNPLDCQRENLRICTRQQNRWNRQANRKWTFSRYKCVRLRWRYRNGVKTVSAKKWYAQVRLNGKYHRSRLFADERDAYHASVELLKALHGEYACIAAWQGYSDTPALRELLGRENGPAEKKVHHGGHGEKQKAKR